MFIFSFPRLQKRFSFHLSAFLMLFAVASLFQPIQSFGHHPFADRDVDYAARQQNWEQRRAFMADINDRLGKDLEGREEFVMDLAEGRARNVPGGVLANRFFGGPSLAFPTGIGPIGSTGDRKLLTVMIEFPDTPGSVDRGEVESAILNNRGSTAELPFDSVHNFYHRASQGKLNLDGEVVGWVEMDNKRESYSANPDDYKKHQHALLALFTEALKKIDDTTDFSQYDNDNDGDIDGLVVLYAGEPDGWSDFFWAYRWTFFIPEANDVKFDGKTLEQFVFQFVNKRPNGEFDPTVLVHEVGHLLGLNDYYDYCPTNRFIANQCPPNIAHPGPDGGAGKFDMMDGNWGNHNAYSRWLMDWISPQVVGAGEHTVELRASGLDSQRAHRDDPQDAIAVFPALDASTVGTAPAREMFIVEYRKRIGNDSLAPREHGIVIWHIAATPSDAPLQSVYDNSFTTPKQVRFVRAGNASDFNSSGQASSTDFFGSGDEFGPSTIPASISHDGRQTGIQISEIEFDGNTARLKIAVNPRLFAAADTPVPSGPAATTLSPTATNTRNKPNDTGLLDRLIQLERDLTDLSSSDLAQIWYRYAEKSPSELTPEETLEARLVLVKWSQKDGLAALSTYATANEKLKAAAANVVDDALDAFVSSKPLVAGDNLLDPAEATIRSLVNQTGSLEFVRKAFEARAFFDEQSVADDLSLLRGVETTFSAVNGLKAGGVTVESLESISKKFVGERSSLDAVINFEKAVQNFEAKMDFVVPPQFSNEVMNSITKQLNLGNSIRK